MRTLNTLLRRSRHRDDGVALVVSISLVGLIGILTMALVSVALAEARSSGRDRQRSAAVMDAEGSVDRTVASIQSAAPAVLASSLCGTLAPTSSSVGADALSVTTTVRYFTSGGVPIPCASLATATDVAQATVSATSVSGAIVGTSPARRTVETLLELTPNFGNDLDKAIFGNSAVRLANRADIYGQNGQPNADVYTNGNLICDNNQHYFGSIFVQGSVQMSNTCTIEVDLYARGNITFSNPGVTVNGNVRSSRGSISLDRARVGQQARARLTVTGDTCAANVGKCIGNDTMADPPAQAFPQMRWDGATQTKWAAAPGLYTTVITIPFGEYQCGLWTGRRLVGPDGRDANLDGRVDGAGAWIHENAHRLSGPTVVRSTCAQPVTLSGVGFTLSHNLAVFADGGVTFSGNSPVRSTSAADRNLYLIQPYDARPQPCTVDGITLDNQVTVDQTVNVLLYSPCNVRKANNTTHFGQIYAGGTAFIDNQLTMYFEPLPVWGVDTTNATIEDYSVAVLYKRENL